MREDGSFADIPLVLGDTELALTLIEKSVRGRPDSFRLLNAYSLYCAQKDPAYGALLRRGGHNFIDGKPLAFLMHRRVSAVSQVRGPALFLACLDRMRSEPHFLFGGSEDLLDALRSHLLQRFPGLNLVGTCAPPFGTFSAQDRALYLDEIRMARPAIVWVALGTPKQDVEAALITELAGVTTIAVGAAFDFAAGRKPEAPVLLRTLGLEWAFRLYSEPRRLWRRYLFGNIYFIRAAFAELRWPTRSRSSRPTVGGTSSDEGDRAV